MHKALWSAEVDYPVRRRDGSVQQGRAKKTGVSVETLVHLWLQEKLAAFG
ncbi:MAG: hypothetical protein AAF657_08345 [Acidobacteriota bacterium]